MSRGQDRAADAPMNGLIHRIIDYHNKHINPQTAWALACISEKRVTYWPEERAYGLNDWATPWVADEQRAKRWSNKQDACAFLASVPDSFFSSCRIVAVDVTADLERGQQLPTVFGYW